MVVDLIQTHFGTSPKNFENGDFANNSFPFLRGKPSNEKTGDKFGLLPNRGGRGSYFFRFSKFI